MTRRDVLVAPDVIGAAGAEGHCQVVDSMTCRTLKGQETRWNLPLLGMATWRSELTMATNDPTKTYLLRCM